jgi:hypothetical protein
MCKTVIERVIFALHQNFQILQIFILMIFSCLHIATAVKISVQVPALCSLATLVHPVAVDLCKCVFLLTGLFFVSLRD